ncbi:MAG TPA: hypothetical protein VHV30_13425 [Polyangiaceae bacterium]|jgi:hypothetical protein|nr:hypothetical protein [Polyangiaceae bacterium]
MADLRRKGPRGLGSIAQARDARSRGETRWTAQAGFVAGAAVLAGLIAHKFVTEHELNTGRQELLSKQRAVVATLGAEWFPLRDNLEHDVLQAAGTDGKGEYPGDSIDPAQKTSDFRTQPGLYLRMRLADATTPASIRAAAAEAKRDGFAACLLRETNDRGIKGETKGGAFAEQPWNLGQAYAATRILTDEWVGDVRDADDDLRLRVFVQQYDKAIRDEIPVAIDVVKRAQFFLLVLDEDVPEAAPYTDGGTMTEAALQLVTHPARVYVFELKDNKELVRLRRSGGGRFIQAGERPVSDDETRDALQRQANNCSLAQIVDADLKAAK